MSSEQNVPLIPDRPEDDEQQQQQQQQQAPATPASPSAFIWLLTVSAGISGLLFGYDTGVISATLVSIDTSLSNRLLTSLDKSIITSSTSLFALLISPFSATLADAFGRRRVIVLADVLFILGALVQALCSSVSGMVVGRSIVGAAVGAASFVAPLYIAELAPAAHRGRLVTVTVLFVTFGQVVAYIVGWLFAEYGSRASGWRWMVGLGAAPAVLQLVVIALVLPETPRWLVKAGRVDAAREVIARVLGGEEGREGGYTPVGSTTDGADSLVDATLRDIEMEIREEDEARKLRSHHGQGDGTPRWTDAWEELFGVRRNRRALWIACLLQGLQQLCGFNSLMYFSATVFTLVGFSIPTLTSLVVAVTNCLFTGLALLVIDRIGRRRVLLWSLPVMIAGLFLAAWGFSMITIDPGQDGAGAGAAPPQDDDGKAKAGSVILLSIMIYVAGYAIGLGNVPWMQSELFSLSVRSLGSGLATATNWGANFVVGLTFLPLMDALSPSWTFVLYAIVCVVGYGLVYRMFPETSGLSLEEAAQLLEDEGWGVR